MKIKNYLRKMAKWITRRSILFFSLLLFAAAILTIWFISFNNTTSSEQIIISIAAITAFFSFVSSFATLLQAVEIQKQREDLERPYINAYFEGNSNGAFYFVIQNSGNLPAQNITFKFDPSPIDHMGRKIEDISLFNHPITFLPASKEIRQIINATSRFFEEGNQIKFLVKINYQSVYGASYNECVEHDLEYLKQTTLPRKTSEDYLKDISSEIKDLTQLLKNAQGSAPFIIETQKEHISRINEMYEENKKINLYKRLVTKIYNIMMGKNKT